MVVLTESQTLLIVLDGAYDKSIADGTSLESVLKGMRSAALAPVWDGGGLLTMTSTSNAGQSISFDSGGGGSGGGSGLTTLDSVGAAQKLLIALETCKEAILDATDAQLHACVRSKLLPLARRPPRAVRPNFAGL